MPSIIQRALDRKKLIKDFITLAESNPSDAAFRIIAQAASDAMTPPPSAADITAFSLGIQRGIIREATLFLQKFYEGNYPAIGEMTTLDFGGKPTSSQTFVWAGDGTSDKTTVTAGPAALFGIVVLSADAGAPTIIERVFAHIPPAFESWEWSFLTNTFTQNANAIAFDGQDINLNIGGANPILNVIGKNYQGLILFAP